jgi:alanine racemase
MSTRPHHGRAWADVSLPNLVANARVVLAELPGTRLLPMVKADAYGLGAVPCARALEVLDPWGYGVATLAEAGELRQAGLGRPMLVFSPGDPSDLEHFRDLDCRAVLDRSDAVRAWDQPFHLEVDTGMSRCGVRWDDAVALASCQSPHLEGAFTHLHSADTDPGSVKVQLDRFARAIAALGSRPRLLHVANSVGAWRLSQGFDLVRPGIFLYGGSHAPDLPLPAQVLSLHAPVVSVRRLEAGDTVSYGGDWTAPNATTIATLGIGYADGIPRALAPDARVLLRGARIPIVGRVTMDFIMVDAGSRGAVRPGDIATLIGADGSATITVDEFAGWARTVSYEILARLGARLPRRYHAA